MHRALLLLLCSCGSLPIVAEPLLKPNVAEACDRAIKCGVFLPAQRPECIACVETVADRWNAEAKEICGDSCPALKDIPCDIITDYSHKTNLSECVVRRAYGP